MTDDWSPCQDLAERMRERGVEALIAPSAALPGTRNLVLFGQRVAIAYDHTPRASIDVPVSITSDRGGPPVGLLDLVRHRGEPHPELEAWKNGESFRLAEPDYGLTAT